MSDNTNDGGPAYPSRGGMIFYVPDQAKDHIEDTVSKLDHYHSGMSLRDYFAAKAMQGLLTQAAAMRSDSPPYRIAANVAYAYADAMLAAREVKS